MSLSDGYRVHAIGAWGVENLRWGSPGRNFIEVFEVLFRSGQSSVWIVPWNNQPPSRLILARLKTDVFKNTNHPGTITQLHTGLGRLAERTVH